MTITKEERMLMSFILNEINSKSESFDNGFTTTEDLLYTFTDDTVKIFYNLLNKVSPN